MGYTNLKWMFWMYNRGTKLTVALATFLRALRTQLVPDRRGSAYGHSRRVAGMDRIEDATL